ncbi:MAG: hypothetical protein OXG37_09740 [Actinomycetia bacterium]|nr:hypothetical protein [Actinomycetes bacterium]
MSDFEKLAELGLQIDSSRLERAEASVSSDFVRVTTTVVLAGQGYEGRGEDVTYYADDHEVFPRLELVGAWTLRSFSASLEGQELFPAGEPLFPAARDYRRWAIESAALDLALRQAGASLGEVVERTYEPVRFVVSTRHDPRDWLALEPQLEFKLDPTGEWDREFMRALTETGRIRVLDLKAYYETDALEVSRDRHLYQAAVELFPDAVIEDPALTDELRGVLEPAEARLSFDAPIHSVADVESLPVSVRHLNIKPSRFGSLERLFACLAWCGERGVSMYGGGQFELGVGRSHIQTLASLYYASGPNDVAPAEYNEPEPRAGLPRSPLLPSTAPVGLSFS